MRSESLSCPIACWEVLNGVGVDGVRGILPFFTLVSFSLLFCFLSVAFLHFSLFFFFFFVFLRFSLILLEDKGKRQRFTAKWEFHSDPVQNVLSFAKGSSKVSSGLRRALRRLPEGGHWMVPRGQQDAFLESTFEADMITEITREIVKFSVSELNKMSLKRKTELPLRQNDYRVHSPRMFSA